ncbi:hypothetical protein PInf_001741 [Phytophthora infestans]|nr:hypothetical protein PInf_001741 [Phytophthora infestans]
MSMRSFRAQDPVQIAKNDQKKLRKALERAAKQERKEARKKQKLARKSHRSLRERGSSSNRIALLSASSVYDCSITSNEEILAEIWAMRSSFTAQVSDEDVSAADDKAVSSAPIEFLFFMGCPDDSSREIGYLRARPKSRSARNTATASFATAIATTIPVKSTLVSNMPSLLCHAFEIAL